MFYRSAKKEDDKLGIPYLKFHVHDRMKNFPNQTWYPDLFGKPFLDITEKVVEREI
jgi:hypothetical protein